MYAAMENGDILNRNEIESDDVCKSYGYSGDGVKFQDLRKSANPNGNGPNNSPSYSSSKSESECKIEMRNDYTATENNFICLITHIKNTMQTASLEKGNSNVEVKIFSEKLTELISYLLEKSWEDNSVSTNNCLKMFFENDILNEVYNWIAGNKEIMKLMTKDLLQIYNSILSIGSDGFIRNMKFVEPLLLLLLALKPNEKKRMPHDMESSYVQVLSRLSARLIDEQFLERFQKVTVSKQGYKLPRFAFINLLMFYVYEDGPIGNQARDSLIVCAQISANNNDFGKYIAKESDCCNILAAGLIGLYSALPTTLNINSDDWYCITTDMISSNKEIQNFVKALRFCCEVIKFGHAAIQERFLCLIHDGFLSSVLAAALHQPITEAIIAAVAYLELILKQVTEITFMRVILKFLFTDDYDGRLIVDTLIDLISTKSPQLCMVTLQLFKTLMDLNCEDVVFHLIIRYLIPCSHLLPNQKRTIKELDFYCKSATMFLYLTPSCCLEASLPSDEMSDECPTLPDSKHAKTILRKSFTKCLSDAKFTVKECKQACQCWSAVYDGMDVMTEFPRRSGSSILISQSKTDRRNSEVFSFAMQRSKSITDSEKEDENLKHAKTLKIVNGYSDTIEEEDFTATEGLGPFLLAVFEKLEKMPENSFYINLQVTSLVSRIACYPQPLLRSLLLNSNLIMQPGVKSLFQILTNISHASDAFICQLDDFKSLMLRARSNLFKREHKFYDVTTNSARRDSNASSLSVAIDAKDESSVESSKASDQTARNINTCHASKGTAMPQGARKDSLFCGEPSFEVPKNVGSTIGRLHPAIRSPTKRASESLTRVETGLLKRKNPTAIKNAIYCAIILEEWLKELAAISLEHNVV